MCLVYCPGSHFDGVYRLGVPSSFFSCSVYCWGTCEASQGHVDGRFWGDFVRGGGFRVAYAVPGRVWMVFSRLAPTYIFSVQCILWGVLWCFWRGVSPVSDSVPGGGPGFPGWETVRWRGFSAHIMFPVSSPYGMETALYFYCSKIKYME